ncbi:MAG: cadherin-like beta sandwich domain-containing protein [Verrucomicrobiaceae bacterium]|nr:cadherin-like beta sandwich domain-containing protein [Verrucomicrobiaceae bacterium]
MKKLVFSLLLIVGSSAQAAGVAYSTIQGIYNAHCITCHGSSGAEAGLNLQTSSYTNTVNVSSGKYSSHRVRPNFANSSKSAIYHVIVAQGNGPNHKGGSWVATAGQKTSLTNWINQGALQNENPPTVTSVAASTGGSAGGTNVTITGTRFGGTGAYAPVVTFGGVAATNVVVTEGRFDRITCTTPPHAEGTVDVIVTTTTGGASAPLVGGFSYTAGPPSKLAFLGQPSNGVAGAVLPSSVQVQIQDAANNPTSSTANITLALSTNPGASTLSGTLTVTAVAGVATFSNLSLDRAGTGYRLLATSGGLTSITSNVFDITATQPVVALAQTSSLTATSASFNSSVESDGGGTVTTRGFVYSLSTLNPSPTIGAGGVIQMASGSGLGAYTASVSGLKPGASYAISAYATNLAGTAYSTPSVFFTLSNDTNLSSLSLSAGTLTPAFGSAITNYSVTVPYSSSSIAFSVTTSSTYASVTVNGSSPAVPVGLLVGNNDITMRVTAQDGSTQDYVVAITRTAPSQNSFLANLAVERGTLSPQFDQNTPNYTLTVPYAQSTLLVSPFAEDAFATTTVNGGIPSVPVTLSQGPNIILVTVTAEDLSSRTYTVNVTRSPESSSSSLQSLATSSGTLDPVFHFAETSYLLPVTLETESIAFTPVLSASGASLFINEIAATSGVPSTSIGLVPGDTHITIRVTSQDTTSTTSYEVVVRRMASSDADLSNLLTNIGNLEPTFQASVTQYDLSVSETTSAVTFSPTAANAFASLKINDVSLQSGGTSLPIAIVPGPNEVKIVVTAQDATTKTYTVNVNRTFGGPPRIISQPASRIAATGMMVGFQVGAIGAGTITYEWRKNGVKRQGATSSSLVINNTTATDAGTYTVIVSNSFGSIISDAATLAISKPGTSGAPEIVNQPQSILAPVGSAVAFGASAIGTPTPSLAWRKKGLTSVLSTTGTLAMNPISLGSSGVYYMQAKNTGGAISTVGARLGVVDTTATVKQAKVGTVVSLTVSAAGEALLHQWKKDGAEMTGATSSKLLIKTASLLDTGHYSCLIRMGDKTLESGVIDLQVYDKAPIIMLPVDSMLPPAIVSGTYSFVVPADTSSERAVVAWSAKGLPKGVSIHPTSGIISGKPLLASPSGSFFSVKITATNGSGSHTVPVRLVVSPLTPGAAGTYNGLVDRDSSLNQSYGGSLSLTVASDGMMTGKLGMGKVTLPFTKVWLDTFISSTPTGTIELGAYSVHFAINPSTGELTGNVRSATTAPIGLSGWRHTAPPAITFGRYNAVIDLTPSQLPNPIGDPDYPQGSGFGTLTVSAAGISWNGRLADGVAYTISTTIGSTSKIPFHLMLYGNTGSIHGWLTLSAPDLDGSIDWGKSQQAPTSTSHNYITGFSLHKLTVMGSRYIPPVSPILGLSDGGPGTTNAKLTFSEAGISTSAQYAPLNGTTFRVTTTNSLVLPTGAANPTGLNVKLDAATGGFFGSFDLKNDPDPTDTVAPIRLLTRNAKFYGLVVTRTGIERGVGHFLLSELPQIGPPTTTLLTSDILSGRVNLGPK